MKAKPKKSLGILQRPEMAPGLCKFCDWPLRGFICRCPTCGADCHEGDCIVQHEIQCSHHHTGVCGDDCRFCKHGEMIGQTAIGG